MDFDKACGLPEQIMGDGFAEQLHDELLDNPEALDPKCSACGAIDRTLGTFYRSIITDLRRQLAQAKEKNERLRDAVEQANNIMLGLTGQVALDHGEDNSWVYAARKWHKAREAASAANKSQKTP